MTLSHLPSQSQSVNPFQQAALFKPSASQRQQRLPNVLREQNSLLSQPDDRFELQQGFSFDEATDGVLQALSTPARKRDAVPLLIQTQLRAGNAKTVNEANPKMARSAEEISAEEIRSDERQSVSEPNKMDKITARYRRAPVSGQKPTIQNPTGQEQPENLEQEEFSPAQDAAGQADYQATSWVSLASIASTAKEVILDLFFEPVPVTTLTQGGAGASGQTQSVVVSGKSGKQTPIGLAQLTRYTFNNSRRTNGSGETARSENPSSANW